MADCKDRLLGFGHGDVGMCVELVCWCALLVVADGDLGVNNVGGWGTVQMVIGHHREI